MAKASKSHSRRVAIVGGIRTPFVKSGGVFRTLSAIDLGRAVVAELLPRFALKPKDVSQLVFGAVVPQIEAPNIAREIGLAAGLPPSVDAYSVSRACATSTQSLVNGAQAILGGEASVVIAGGVDSLSRPPIVFRDGFVDILMRAKAARDPWARAKIFLELKAKDLLPKAPGIKELSTGLSMGESAEKMAKDNGIARGDQDALALASHQKTAKAWDEGIYADEVMAFAVPPKFDATVVEDNLFRRDTSLEKLAKLRPAFDKEHGSITAGNSSPLTDGASAVVLMEEATAKALGHTPLAYVRSWGFAGLDPNWQLLMGPAFAAPKALDRAGLTLEDIDLVDMHEAFAAQVLSNLQAFSSAKWCRKHLGRDQALGEVAEDKLNVCGGSIAIGHPFAATGTRQALTMARALHRRGGGMALITQCAAGGLGASLILEGAQA